MEGEVWWWDVVELIWYGVVVRCFFKVWNDVEGWCLGWIFGVSN